MLPTEAPAYFIPYVYMPSVDASYIKIVTPWGNLHLEREMLVQSAITALVFVLSIVAYRLLFTTGSALPPPDATEADTSTASPSGASPSKKASKGSAGGKDHTPMVGENSYHYTRQHSSNGSATSDSSYGWTDMRRSVVIYLTDESTQNLKHEDVTLSWTKTSLSLELPVNDASEHSPNLMIPTLFGEISNATWEVNKHQLTITLTKADSRAWTSLNGASKNLEKHIEYDQSLFD